MKSLWMSVPVTVVMLLLNFPEVTAWNIPGHMLSGAIAYQILQRESPGMIARARSILENNPWYETRWKAQLDKQLESDRNEMLFQLEQAVGDIKTQLLQDHSNAEPVFGIDNSTQRRRCQIQDNNGIHVRGRGH